MRGIIIAMAILVTVSTTVIIYLTRENNIAICSICEYFLVLTLP